MLSRFFFIPFIDLQQFWLLPRLRCRNCRPPHIGLAALHALAHAVLYSATVPSSLAMHLAQGLHRFHHLAALLALPCMAFTKFSCVNKVLRTLRRHAYHKAVVARGEACHKGLHLYNLARITVHIAHGVSRKVEENLFAAYIQVFENGRLTVVLLGRDVLAVVVAELREAVAAGVVPAVLFPQQLQRHMLALD